MIDEKKSFELRLLWEKYPGYEPNYFKETLDTIDGLWKIVRAAQQHCTTHGHTSDSTLDFALVDAGLLDKSLVAWKKDKRKK